MFSGNLTIIAKPNIEIWMNTTNLTIKEWAVEDRPREKLQKSGVRHLSDAELLAILIGSGSRNQTAVELSRNIV